MFQKQNFNFKKQFGQNFIFDKNFLISLVEDFNLNKNSQILEIGAGAGTLTEVLANNFEKVISVEIDKTLKEHLMELEEKYSNLKFIFDDVLKLETKEFDNIFKNKPYIIIANLPYYITSQIVFKFLLESKTLEKMYVMVQKEVGERFCANVSTKEYGIPTVLIDCFGSAKIIKNVKRTMFYPEPKIDSCILKIEIDRNKYKALNKNQDVKEFCLFVSSCFKMKRKTLINNLQSMGISKEKIQISFKKLDISSLVRPENLTSNDFLNLYNEIYC